MCSFIRENGKKCMLSFVLLVAFCGFMGKTFEYHFQPVSIVGEGNHKSVSTARTSVSYRYSAQFNKVLKNVRYRQFTSMYQPDLSSAVPGLSSTDILGKNCNRMVPQGICFAEDYMIISAYDGGENKGGSKKNPSVLYILSNEDAQNRTYLTTIVLPDINHVGGLAYDGRYLWIAKSTTKTCSAIDISAIEHAVMSGQNSCAVEYTATVPCDMTASFLTYYDNRLWIGTFANRSRKEGMLKSFQIKGSGRRLALEEVNSVSIPYNANGINIEKVGQRVCMAVMTSFSRASDSTVYLYELENDDTAKIRKVYHGIYKFPPMGEEIASDGTDAYFIFESAATCYTKQAYRKCMNPVDRVCAVKISDLYYWSDIALLSGTMPDEEVLDIDRICLEGILPKDGYELLKAALCGRTARIDDIPGVSVRKKERRRTRQGGRPEFDLGRYKNGIMTSCLERAG